MAKQQTINAPISFFGKGLHTGKAVNLTILPGEPNTGRVFQRTDLEGQPCIEALAEHVTKTTRGTVLTKGDVEVCTVEHCLSALYAMGIDNALIQLDSAELPILDGSAKPYTNAIVATGIQQQDAECEDYVVTQKITYENTETGTKIMILPDDHLSLQVQVEYDSLVLSNQFATLETLDNYTSEIASARTFVFVHELAPLAEMGLIRGGDLDNALVVYDRLIDESELTKIATQLGKPCPKADAIGYIGNTPANANEPARHKLLDFLGDLSLIGTRLVGRVIATMPGHTANTAFAKKLRKDIKRLETATPIYRPEDAPLMDVNRIKQLLPHRYPFLLVDKVISRTETSIVTVKNITFNEMQFLGHFPEEPVMPGVLQIEAMAQSAGLLVLSQVEEPERYSTYFLKINNVKFRNKVVPGDTMVMKVMLTSPIRRGLSDIKGYVFVGGKIVTEAEMVAQIVKNK
ncbi:MAG: bifunctional UDP-3-O-[3-hydroxymyristoyl] N-acetylglucosamine deacetylase/3-hydroxyacyl-ACP dehydratase [Bacteroidales bacterium]|nr:bifunctional UDP-3-O-[3-hydroxymyristoyl] N-acetylglucosamine deacetylase/3-hydroxyacyl-ACP dehydratase [Bacteroidales bacterium]